MNEEAKRLVEALREDAEWAHANEWETPITLGDNLEAAANMIEKLSADRDAWKRRCEAAESDINAVLRAHVDDLHCDQCKKGGRRWVCRYYTSDMCPDAEWRGPCEENGGAEDETKA